MLAWLGATRETVLDGARIARGEIVVDVGAGTGLLTLGAAERVGPDGDVLAVDISVDALEELQRGTRVPNISYLVGTAEVLPFPDESVDVVVMRSVLIYVAEKDEATRELVRVLRRGGRVSIFEPINSRNRRLNDLVDFGDLGARVSAWESARYDDPADPMLNFDEHDLERQLKEAGFVELSAVLRDTEQELPAEQLLTAIGAPGRASLVDEWSEAFSPGEVARLSAAVRARDVYSTTWTGLFLTGEKPR